MYVAWCGVRYGYGSVMVWGIVWGIVLAMIPKRVLCFSMCMVFYVFYIFLCFSMFSMFSMCSVCVYFYGCLCFPFRIGPKTLNPSNLYVLNPLTP